MSASTVAPYRSAAPPLIRCTWPLGRSEHSQNKSIVPGQPQCYPRSSSHRPGIRCSHANSFSLVGRRLLSRATRTSVSLRQLPDSSANEVCRVPSEYWSACGQISIHIRGESLQAMHTSLFLENNSRQPHLWMVGDDFILRDHWLYHREHLLLLIVLISRAASSFRVRHGALNNTVNRDGFHCQSAIFWRRFIAHGVHRA